MNTKTNLTSSIKFTEIQLKKCDLGDRSLDIFLKDRQYLENTKPGLQHYLYRPVITQKKNNKYLVFYGFRSVELHRNQDVKNIYAFVITALVPILDILIFIAQHHRQYRDFYPIEIARFMQILIDHKVPDDKIIKNAMPALGLPANSNLLKKYLPLNNIHPRIVDFLHHKNAPLKTWILFADIQAKAQNFFIELVDHFNPSFSIFEQIVKLLKEISIREELTLYESINDLELYEFLKSDKDQKRVRLEGIRRTVFRARFPILSKHQDKIENAIRSLQLPSQVSISWDKTFEKKELNIVISIKTQDDFAAFQQFLESSNFKKIKDLLKIL